MNGWWIPLSRMIVSYVDLNGGTTLIRLGKFVHIICTLDLEPRLNNHFVLVRGSRRLYSD